MNKLCLQRQRNRRSNCQNPLDHRKRKRIPEKHTSASLTMLKTWTVWITTNCGKFLKRWEYQTTLPVSQETCMQVKKQVRTVHGTTHWFQIGKGVCQGCILWPCLFNFYAEYNMWNASLDDSQAGIEIVERSINNFRYADDIFLKAESKEEL